MYVRRFWYGTRREYDKEKPNGNLTNFQLDKANFVVRECKKKKHPRENQHSNIREVSPELNGWEEVLAVRFVNPLDDLPPSPVP